MKNQIRNAFALISTAILVFTLTACAAGNTQTFGSVDRANLYASLDSLISDSPQILIGKVTATNVVHDEQLKMDVTLATVEVYKVSKPSAETATSVVVRQTGTANTMANLKFMQVGRVYAIFAIISDQTANPNREYDIRGVDAGIYEADASVATTAQALASDATYSRLDSNSGDTLPASIHLSEIAGF